MNNTGTVTFVTAGTVIITATKDAEGDLKQVTDSYTLYITMKPRDKAALVEEIKRITNVEAADPTQRNMEADLNYIDTSAIIDMRYLFSNSKTNGHGLSAFNGDISMWDVSAVTHMIGMFAGNTVFNGELSEWKVGSVTFMNNMFVDATAFNQNLNSWGSRLNVAIKNHWTRTITMFTNSGLAGSLPAWCETSACKDLQ